MAHMEFGSYNLDAAEVMEVHDTDNEFENKTLQETKTLHAQRGTNKNIPRPHGEPGRPNSGGSTLAVELAKTGWSRKSVEQLLAATHVLYQERLDLTKCYRKQNKREVQKTCDEVCECPMLIQRV
ncbi:hypothetical protein C0989_006481 [Termitomyces sp. Mn162]|nr:hypothetical protein C0989_006481 [Termitomyces sp. Mn162]